MTLRLAIAGLVAACASTAPPPAAPTPPEPRPPVAKPPPPPQKGTPFGRFTAVQPGGYAVDARGDNLAFEREGVMIALVDGADQAEKCLSMLAAFATGMVTGLARAPMNVDVTAGNPLPNGCRLAGSAANGTALVEAAAEIEDGGVALAILLHKNAEDGGSAAFDRVVTSVRRAP
jgi:hypothetical protein